MADRQRQPAAQATSQTTTQTAEESEQRTETPRTLRLRGASHTSGRSVQWAEDVVDNEGLGRKSSKVCCIYHKPKAVDESSDESSSDSSSSDSDSDSAADKASRDGDKKVPACGHSHHGRRRGKKPRGKQGRPPSPNAYEKVPKPPKPKNDAGASNP